MNKTTVLAALAVIGLSACVRHVTIDPDLVPQKNSAGWVVESAPRPANAPQQAKK